MAGSLVRTEQRAPLRRFNPLRDFSSAFDMLDVFRALHTRESDTIPLDVTETPQAYLVKAEMPGVRREDIKVAIQGEHVSISTETKTEEERTEGTVVFRERFQGQQFRSFILPQPVDEDAAKAVCHDGVLELTLPKKTGGGAKQLAIQ